MKYADCRVGSRVIVHDPDEGDRIGTIDKLHPILKLQGRLPPGSPGFVTNFVSVRFDEPRIENTPRGPIPVVGVTLNPTEIDPLN